VGRRSTIEGSIYRRRKGGLWVAQYVCGYPRGQAQEGYIYGRRSKDVADKLAEIQKERGDGLLLDTGNLTVAGFFANWLESEKESVGFGTPFSVRADV